jgi:hypothetical protein
MPVLRLLLAGLVALGAILATLLAAAVVVFGGLAAFVLQFFRPKAQRMKSTGPRQPNASPQPPIRPGEDVIDI